MPIPCAAPAHTVVSTLERCDENEAGSFFAPFRYGPRFSDSPGAPTPSRSTVTESIRSNTRLGHGMVQRPTCRSVRKLSALKKCLMLTYPPDMSGTGDRGGRCEFR